MVHSNIMIIMIMMICSCITNALDVSWIPNDPDGPLPLSIQYRQSLRRLCSLIEKGSRLPAEVESKRNVLKKMCTKLRSDDDAIQSSIKFNHNIKTAAIAATSLGTSYFIWTNRRAITNIYNNIKRSFNKRDTDSDQMLKEIREARLKRFQ